MPEPHAAAAGLLERLLADPEFRAAYRRDPAGAARAAGFAELAPELALPARRALETLEVRESRQGLAGVMMAAAIEGAAIMAFSEHVVPGLADLLPHVEQAQAATPRQGHAIADQLGMEGSGGTPTPETLALLENHNVAFDASGIADLKAGRIDPRIVSVLSELGRDHKLVVSALCSDHPKLTAGGSISNHYYGRAMDIAAVDGKPVSASNAAARELALALNGLDPSIRPSEVGSPWALPGSSDFTDAAHQNHLHVGFDDPVSGQSQPPAGPAAHAAPQAVPAPSEGGDGRNAAQAQAQADSADTADDSDDSDDSDDADDGDDGDDGDAEGPSAPASAGDDEDENEPDEDEPDEAGPSGGDGEGDEGPDVSDGDTGEDPDSHDDNSDAQSSGSQDDNSDADEDPDSHDDNSDAQPDNADDADQSSDSSSGGGEGDPDQSSDSSGGGGADPGDSQLGGKAIDYPGDDAGSKDIAAWMSDAAKRRGLPPELPVMAALVESGMTNADHGDADSLGFFQMRASVWDSGPYAGYAHKPKLQLKWFLDAAERVQQDRKSRGLPMDKDHYGEWVADVERPAAQYRGRYQLRLDEARELLRRAADGKSNGSAAEVAAGAVDSASMTAGPNALTALKAAEKQLGVRYVWGGASPKTGFDCSGLVQWAYARAGVKLPRTSEEQILAPGGKAVSRGKLLPGDLVFFRNASGDVHHVGMSLGGDKFVAAPHTGDVVQISSLKEPGYAKEFIGGRRFDGAVHASTRGANARVLPVVTP